MKSLKFFKPTLAIVLAWLLSIGPAQAGYIVTLEQVGPDVVATGSGPINLTGLNFFQSTSANPEIRSRFPRPAIFTGPTSSSVDLYSDPRGPTSFGSNPFTRLASSGSGDMVGIFVTPLGNSLVVPRGYVSDTFLSDTATYSGTTLALLGVTPGTYVWTWGTGANQNFTLQIPSHPPTATPVVSISVSPAQIGEGDSATFQITASANTIRPVVLNYTMSGEATFGLDYGLTGAPGQNGQIVIPFGLDAVSITLTAFVDLVTEKKETAIMALQPGVGYKLSKPKKAKVIISKNATF